MITAQEKALNTAKSKRAAAAYELNELRRALERAQLVVSDADAVMNAHTTAEEASSTNQAKRLEEWITDGCRGKPPTNPDDKNLSDMRSAAMKAQGERSAALKALASVNDRFLKAGVAYQESDQAVSDAVNAVIAADAKAMAEEIVAAEARAFTLRLNLASIPGPLRGIGEGNPMLSMEVRRIMDNPPERYFVSMLTGENPYRMQTEKLAIEWQSRIATLHQDSQDDGEKQAA